jgi:hypothetical protein
MWVRAWFDDALTSAAHIVEMLGWLPKVTDDPQGSATARLSGVSDGFTAHVPRTLAWVEYVVIHHGSECTVVILGPIENVPEAMEDPEPT